MDWEVITTIVCRILDHLLEEVNKCKDRNSPIKKELRNEIENLIYEWEEKWRANEELMYNKYISWHEHEKEINEWVEKLSNEKPISDVYLDEIFHWTISKVKSLSDLINKQIEWYDKNLDLSNQLNKEKETLIEHLKKDLDTYFWIIYSFAEKWSQENWWANVNDINTAYQISDEFKKNTINETSILIDKIIKKISVR